MTEAEWLAATNPAPMLKFLANKASDRKLRLFAVACSRRIATPFFSAPLDVAERFADGLASDTERSVARKEAQRAAQVKGMAPVPTAPKWERRAVSSAYYATARSAWQAAMNAGQLVLESLIWKAGGYGRCDVQEIQARELGPQTALLRDIFGNPFRTVEADPTWWTTSAVSIAEAIYQERTFKRLPALAGELHDAGCSQDAILNHCRNEGSHVRGCWIVDLLTGRK